MENEKVVVENIIREGAKSFSGTESTKYWTNETIWFDAAPLATKGVDRAKKIFDEAFGSLRSCDVDILDMRTFINGSSALVCSSQKWNTVSKEGAEATFMMRQTDYLEKIDGEWKILHEHTSSADGWDGAILE